MCPTAASPSTKTPRSKMSKNEKRQWGLVILAVVTLMLSAGWQSYSVGNELGAKADADSVPVLSDFRSLERSYNDHLVSSALQSGRMNATLLSIDNTLTEIKVELKELRDAR